KDHVAGLAAEDPHATTLGSRTEGGVGRSDEDVVEPIVVDVADHRDGGAEPSLGAASLSQIQELASRERRPHPGDRGARQRAADMTENMLEHGTSCARSAVMSRTGAASAVVPCSPRSPNLTPRIRIRSARAVVPGWGGRSWAPGSRSRCGRG